MRRDLFYAGAVKDRRSEFHAQLLPGPAEYRLIDLPEVHTRRHPQRVQHYVDRRPVFQEWHVFRTYDLGDDTLVTVAARHLISHFQLTLDCEIHLRQFQHTRG